MVNSAAKIALRSAARRPRRKIQRLAVFRFSAVAPGGSKTVTFKLTSKARRYLVKTRALKAPKRGRR